MLPNPPEIETRNDARRRIRLRLPAGDAGKVSGVWRVEGVGVVELAILWASTVREMWGWIFWGRRSAMNTLRGATVGNNGRHV